jgi:tetratricopeptide (TPR) repeat protein
MLAVVTNLPAGARREEFEWMLDDIARRLELMNAGRTDSLYAGTRTAFTELAAEVLLQAHALPPAEGVTATWLDGRLDRLAALRASVPAAVAIARAQIAWDRTGAIADAAPFLRAPEIATSSLLAFHAGRALLAIKLREQSRTALERAVALDPDFTLPLVFLAAAEYEISTANAPRAVAHLEAFLARPEGRRLPPGDPTSQKLEAYARGLLARIRP